MGQHVAFGGGWSNVGDLAAKRADFNPSDTFSLEVRLDVAKRTGTAVINETKFKFQLPDSLKAIRHIGIYNKAAVTEFTLPVVDSK